jgi:hypothetical protein
VTYNAKRDDIISCEFHQWYNKFTKITMKSIVISLPLSFIQYLNEDGIMLPKSANHDIDDQLSDDDDLKKQVKYLLKKMEDYKDLEKRNEQLTMQLKTIEKEIKKEKNKK